MLQESKKLVSKSLESIPDTRHVIAKLVGGLLPKTFSPQLRTMIAPFKMYFRIGEVIVIHYQLESIIPPVRRKGLGHPTHLQPAI